MLDTEIGLATLDANYFYKMLNAIKFNSMAWMLAGCLQLVDVIFKLLYLI